VGRIRCIKPEFPQSESIGRLSRDARLLFIQLWTLVDDSGRTRGASRMLASLLYPYDSDAPKLIEGWLAELEAENHIRRYQADGHTFLEILNFLTHQKIDHPTASKLPAFDESSRILANPREELLRKGREGKGEDMERGGDPAILQLPCAGRKAYGVSQKQIDRWKELYPAVDVMQELRGMVAWLEASPKRQKTADGAPRFCASWLGRAQDQPKRNGVAVVSTEPKLKTRYELNLEEQRADKEQALREAAN
jgi:hypothetical protein